MTIRRRKARLLNNFQVGCDPEFAVINPTTGTLHNVSKLFPREGEVGWDHGGWCMEIRPEPSRGTYRLLVNIRDVLASNPRLENISQKRWRGGAFVENPNPDDECVALGGHIHLDIPPNHPDFKEIIAALSDVTKLLEHLELIPDSEVKRRRGFGFGSIPNVRTDHGRLEFRSMPSWMHSPVIALLSLTSAKLAACEPQHTREMLGGVTGYAGLKKFYASFKGKDDNADRIIEKIFERRTLAEIQCDYTKDFREEWRRWKGRL